MAIPSSTPTPPMVDLRTILTETQRIISAHSPYSLLLSLLFLLLPSFSLSLLPSLLYLPLLPLSLFSLFLFFSSLLSTSSITNTTLHAFYGRPINPFPQIPSSFPPLLLTSSLSIFLLSSFAFLSFSLLFFLFRGIRLLGVPPSPYITLPFAALSLSVLILLVYFRVDWSLSSVVVVAESTWGIHPLKRSRFLLHGARRAALWIFLLSRILVVLVLVGVSLIKIDASYWVFVVRIVGSSSLLMVVFLYNVAANTVLYMYCKAARGELAWEIAEEFARDYVSLPFDEHKLPHVVSVVYP